MPQTLLRLSLVCVVLSSTVPVFAQTALPSTAQHPPLGKVGNLPHDWQLGKFNRRTFEWDQATARNIKWVAQLGSQTFGAPIVGNGKVFVGTNNSGSRLPRFPATTDLGVLLCFRESNGEFLWQYQAEKLPSGRVNDLALQGISSAPWIEGERAWFVSNRGEVVCVDTQGFADREDDGAPFADSSVLSSGYEKKSRAELIVELDRQVVGERWTPFLLDHWQVKASDYRAEVVEAGKSWRLTPRNNPREPSFSLTLDFWGVRAARERATPDPHEADVVWSLNMMDQFGSRQHTCSPCCVSVWGDTLFVCTGNGVDESHLHIPAPAAPSFVALDKSTGKVLWTSNLPGQHIHHGNWSSPAVGVLGGVPQVIFNGGDGWAYSFHAEEWQPAQAGEKFGLPKLLWKFDTNPKGTQLELGGRGTRNEPIGAPVLYEGRVFLTTGQDAEHGEGPGCIWCLDPSKRGDVSAELVTLRGDPKHIVPYHHRQPVQAAEGHVVIPNPNSAVVWKYTGEDQNSDGKIDVNEQMHRSLTPVAIAGELLVASDFAGYVHCLDRKTGRLHWHFDALAAIWSPPFIADGKIYVTDEDGDVSIFQATADPLTAGKVLDFNEGDYRFRIDARREINMQNSCYTSPTASNGVLFIANKDHLFAIEAPAK